MTRFCSHCGAQAPAEANFCKACGKALTPPVPQQQPIYQPQYAQQPPAYQPQYAQPPQPAYQPQYAQQPPQPAPAMPNKQTVLANAPAALNRPEQPWWASVEGDSIVVRWKWMDATFFAPHEVNEETRQFTFTATLTDRGTWKELDVSEKTSAGVKTGGGKVGFGTSSSTFVGKSNQKSFQFGAGKNNQTGETGLIAFKFNSTAAKQPVRDYLTACGWRKA